MEAGYTIVILVTLVGFLALAAMLLVPVYRFLKREERASRSWTEEELRRQASEKDAGDAARDRGAGRPDRPGGRGG